MPPRVVAEVKPFEEKYIFLEGLCFGEDSIYILNLYQCLQSGMR